MQVRICMNAVHTLNIENAVLMIKIQYLRLCLTIGNGVRTKAAMNYGYTFRMLIIQMVLVGK